MDASDWTDFFMLLCLEQYIIHITGRPITGSVIMINIHCGLCFVIKYYVHKLKTEHSLLMKFFDVNCVLQYSSTWHF